MAPHKPIQTYARQNSSVTYGRSYSGLKRSEDVFDSLLAKNLTQRRIIQHRRKIKVKEVSLNKSTKLTNETLEFDLNDTFDRIARGNIANPVELKRYPVRNISSESDLSRSQSDIAHVQIKIRTPVNKKKTKKSRKRQVTALSNHVNINSQQNVSEVRKVNTFDRSISVSLVVEKENGKLDFRTLSYIRIPDLMNEKGKTELQISVETLDKSTDIHANPFKSLPVSSTPLLPRVNRKVSPDECSLTPNLVQTSLDDIMKWDYSLPSAIITEHRDDQQKNVSTQANHRRNTRSSKKLSFLKESTDPSHFNGFLSAVSGIQGDGCSLTGSKGLFSTNTRQVTSQSQEHSEQIRDCRVVLDKLQLSGRDKLTCTTESFMSQSDCIISTHNYSHHHSTTSVSCSANNLSEELSSNSSSGSSSRSHYKTRESVYITLRKRKVYSKSFVSRSKRSPISLIDKDPSSLVEYIHNKNSVEGTSNGNSTVSEGCSSFDIIPVTPGKTGTSQKLCKRFVKRSSDKNRLQSLSVCSTSHSDNKNNLCGDSLITSDIIPATPEVSVKPHNHFASNKCGIQYHRTLELSSQCQKYIIGRDRFSNTKPVLPSGVTNRSSLPVSFYSHTSSLNGESSELGIQVDNKTPYVLLRRISLPEYSSKSNKNSDMLLSSHTSSSFSELPSMSKNMGELVDVKQPVVRLVKLSSDTSKKSGYINNSQTPVVRLERYPYMPNNKGMFHTKTNTMSSLITINDSSIITVNSSLNNDVYGDSYQRSPIKCENDMMADVSTVSINSPANTKAGTHSNVYKRNRQSCALPVSSTPYSTCKSNQVPKSDLSNVVEELGTFCGIDSKTDVEKKDSFVAPKPKMLVKAGKSWRRSLAVAKKQSIAAQLMECIDQTGHIFSAGDSIERQLSKRLSVKIVAVTPSKLKPRESTLLETYALSKNKSGYVPEQEAVDDRLLEASIRSIRELSLNVPGQQDSLIENSVPLLTLTARDVVLRRCGQAEPLSFRECYTSSCLVHCQKIGEGVYGEVFLYRNQNGGTTVMKVIPIEGSRIVNGERQKKFDEILSEIVIAMELSNLRNNKGTRTTAFSEVIEVKCVQGCYPEKLLELWDLYDETKHSENDSPAIFTEEQLYIILELANGGTDIEAFYFSNASQAYSVFEQTACALAIAEKELKFEHRDLHWGNILVSVVDKKKKIEFCLDGTKIPVATKGVEVSIIDFTLSRIMYDGCVIYNDLGEDEDLFTAEGDYQFEIYRQMQKRNGNEWQHFEPYTNVLWLHYLLDKMIIALRYKNTHTKVHKEHIDKLKKMKNSVLSYRSVEELVNKIFL